MTRIFKFIALLLLFNIGLSQAILFAQIARQDSTNAPILPAHLTISHIDINDQFIDFRQLSDASYRNSLEFGESLHQSIDTILPFYNYPQTMNLPHSLNNLTFHFTAIEWGAPHKIKYSYYLEGLEKDWNTPQKQTEAIFTNLQKGTYTLKVKAIGAAQKWTKPFTYTFQIQPAWWETWWAFLLYAMIGLALILTAFHFRRQWQQEELAIQQLIEENKLLKKPVSADGFGLPKAEGFLGVVHQTLEIHLSDENFGIAELCSTLNISRTKLYRKLKTLTGQSASHYIRHLRLTVAKQLLEETEMNVSEVAYKVGFSSPSYFSQMFKEKFGFAPRERRKE